MHYLPLLNFSYFVQYYPSGNLRLDVQFDDSLYVYVDEDFYPPAQRGRVSLIIVSLHLRHSPECTFEYYDDTDSVKKMIYMDWYADTEDVYIYNKNGTIKTIDKYGCEYDCIF